MDGDSSLVGGRTATPTVAPTPSTVAAAKWMIAAATPTVATATSTVAAARWMVATAKWMITTAAPTEAITI